MSSGSWFQIISIIRYSLWFVVFVVLISGMCASGTSCCFSNTSRFSCLVRSYKTNFWPKTQRNVSLSSDFCFYFICLLCGFIFRTQVAQTATKNISYVPKISITDTASVHHVDTPYRRSIVFLYHSLLCIFLHCSMNTHTVVYLTQSHTQSFCHKYSL